MKRSILSTPLLLLALVALPTPVEGTCTDLFCLDESFGSGGRRTVSFDFGGDLKDVGNAVVRVPGEDAVFVVGQVAVGTGNSDFGVIRLDDAGTLDGAFSIDGRANYNLGLAFDGVEAAQDAAIVPWGLGSDYRLAVVGQVERASPGDFDFGVVLVRPNGDLEADAQGGGRVVVWFDAGDDFTDIATAVAVDSLGRIVIGGTVDSAAGNSNWGFVRLHSNLAPDVTFGVDGKVVLPIDGAAELRDLLVQPDDKIVAVGKRDFGDDQTIVARLEVDGSPDTGFGVLGKTVFDLDLGSVRDDSAWGAAIDSAGRIALVGESVEPGTGESLLCLARVLPNGQPDTSFGDMLAGWICIGRVGASIRGRSLALGPGDQILAAGEAFAGGNRDFYLLSLKPYLAVSDSIVPFDLGGTLDDQPRHALLRPDGKLVVAGRAMSAAANFDFAALRVWTDLVFFDDFESGPRAVEWDARVGLP
ncbi:MAG: hypothetical protein H6511_03955 [Holophagales bacterium]|nr:hypothetical protein [Holophagales bacterium]